ncbi:unnamed protein product [Vitrella brassicaformis CCMP3155]|uniref:Uncharacterized protein n=2 Tax=Vitrella brassicaformis TaxID=1169539 RepID=A0A0G4EPW8_VITBC|nr:unnamed protein product [Vitrella brassicaformis CCMP3155]|mmetsp:Transcript_24457/g.60404  ORF Transcript_24457/g.60404 Transcript_24457/m.60404 type:complete len:554 (+) Transcript_24457:362-2023(+)|eukprot:CEL99895.1 unnamed protein product [Vitrella brassicaformis CCMP3155]
MPYVEAHRWGVRLAHLIAVIVRYPLGLTTGNYAMTAFAGVVDGHAEGRAEMVERGRIAAGTLTTISFEQADRTDMSQAELQELPLLQRTEPAIPNPSCSRRVLPSLETVTGLRIGHAVVAGRWTMPALKDIIDARVEREPPPANQPPDPLRLATWVSTSTALRRLDVCSPPRHKAMVLDRAGRGEGAAGQSETVRPLANLEDIGTLECSSDRHFIQDINELQSVLIARGCDGVQGRGLTSLRVDLIDRMKADMDALEMLVALERFNELVRRTQKVRVTGGSAPTCIATFDLSNLFRLPADATSFIKQSIIRLAAAALTVEWKITPRDTTDLQPLETPNDAVKEVAATISFDKAESVAIHTRRNWQPPLLIPRPRALEHLANSAFPVATSLSVTTTLGSHAVAPLVRIIGADRLQVDAGSVPLSAEAWSAYLAELGRAARVPLLRLRVEGDESGPVDWGDRPDALPTISEIQLYLKVPEGVPSEDDYFYAFIQQLLKLRGLTRLEVFEPVGTSRRVLRTRCPDKTIGNFTIDFSGSVQLSRTWPATQSDTQLKR